MYMDLAGNIYFTLGSYMLLYMLGGIACFGTVAFLIGWALPRLRASILRGPAGRHGSAEAKNLHLAHEPM